MCTTSVSACSLSRVLILFVCVAHGQDVMFELFSKNWAYGYVTDFASFETLSSQWPAVVAAAADTETSVA